MCPSLVDLVSIAGELRPVRVATQEWLSQFLASPPSKDEINIKPITRRLAEALRPRWRGGSPLYNILQAAKHQGYLTAAAATRLIQELLQTSAGIGFSHPDWGSFSRCAQNDDVHWDVVRKVEPIEAQEVFDLAVPPTKVFMLANGLIIYDTANFHVPVGEDARQQAIDFMLPSRNLLSPADFKTPVHAPTQEYAGGLYMATRGSNQKQRPHLFGSPQEALRAYRRGEIDIDTPVRILQ